MELSRLNLSHSQIYSVSLATTTRTTSIQGRVSGVLGTKHFDEAQDQW